MYGKELFRLNNFDKKKITLGIALGMSFVALAGYSLLNDTNHNTEPSPKTNNTTTMATTKKDYNNFNNAYLPQYKDDNNICGIAKDKDGNMVAISSVGACPASDILSIKYLV